MWLTKIYKKDISKFIQADFSPLMYRKLLFRKLIFYLVNIFKFDGK